MIWTSLKQDPYCWYRWFAWRPVKLEEYSDDLGKVNTKWCWLQFVHKRRAAGRRKWEYEY